MTGVQHIEDERRRQLERGRDARNDQQHECGELVVAAQYVLIDYGLVSHFEQDGKVPQAVRVSTYKRYVACEDPRVLLRVAGALIAAEIDRLDLAARRAEVQRVG